MHYVMQLSVIWAGTSYTYFTVANVVLTSGVLTRFDHHVCHTDAWKPMAADVELALLCSHTATDVICDGRYVHIMSHLLLYLIKQNAKA